MEFLIRKAEEKDWSAVTAIMSQVQQMHADWRPIFISPTPR